MRQQVADRSPQRHATLPTYYKILLRTEKVLLQYFPVLQSTPPYYSALQSVLRTTKCSSSTTLYYTALLCSTNYYSSTTLYSKSISSLTLYCSSASRILENTVDYCIHGRLLRHAAAHSSTCKQNKSRSGIIAARESISSLTLYCSSASTNLENTVDYCIHGGLLRHAAAHSSACKQNNSRSVINFFTDMLPHPCQCSTRT